MWSEEVSLHGKSLLNHKSQTHLNLVLNGPTVERALIQERKNNPAIQKSIQVFQFSK